MRLVKVRGLVNPPKRVNLANLVKPMNLVNLVEIVKLVIQSECCDS